MSKRTRILLSLLMFACILLGSIGLVWKGVYGWTSFISLPFCAGALAAWTFRPPTAARALGTGALTGLIGCCLFLLVGKEGIICVGMALPIVVPLSTLGSWLVYLVSGASRTRTATVAMLLPLSFWFDVNPKPPVYSVVTSMVVNAPPERVWKHVIAFPDIPDPTEWYFHTGIAYPKRTRIEGSGVGAARFCDLSTGPVIETVLVWNEPYMLAFRATATPAPMEEAGLYGRINPKHLSGYFLSRRGQFQLSALPGGRTLVEGTSWYQHGLWPAEYWRLWCDAIVHRIHTRVLNHIRELSEQDRTAQ